MYSRMRENQILLLKDRQNPTNLNKIEKQNASYNKLSLRCLGYFKMEADFSTKISEGEVIINKDLEPRHFCPSKLP